MGKDFFEKELRNALGVHTLVSWGENYPLCKAMVNHDHKQIKAFRWWQVCDEINSQTLEGAGGGDRERGKRRDGRMSVDLVGLADGASLDEASDERRQTWPPIVTLYLVNGSVITAVTPRRRVMDGMEEVVPVGLRYIGPILEVE